ncbi:AAA family ATPase [Halovenus sp. HT40]|uniref:AAA family ATPase n=1 Tax=Halovenus sp. HT40 TaxID=3126691 RepID=UPI00300E7CE7
MAIRIESLSVENLRRFRGEHKLDFGKNEEASIDVVCGANGSGKTTLADSIGLCLTGEFEDEAPLVAYELVDELSPGDEVSAKVSMTISNNNLGQRYRFSRKFQTSETRRGPVNSVDSLQVQKEKDGQWVDTGSADAVNTAFPLPAFTFCKLDAESSLGIEDAWGGTSWSELVADLGDAAARQSSARGIDLPEYFANDYELGDEMLSRINDLLASIDGRYVVEERQDSLVGRPAESESGGEIQSLAAGEKNLISQAAAVVAGELMPASPPLIGDSMFARVDVEIREKVFEVIQQADRQVLLFAIEPELDGLDISPQFKLERNEKSQTSNIVASD